MADIPPVVRRGDIVDYTDDDDNVWPMVVVTTFNTGRKIDGHVFKFAGMQWVEDVPFSESNAPGCWSPRRTP